MTPADNIFIYSSASPQAIRILRKHSISTEATVREALKAINMLSGASMTLFAFSSDGTLAGTVTDGDIRRGIINGVDLEDNVEKVMHTDFLFTTPGADHCLAIAEGRRKRLSLLPVVENGYVTEILDLQAIKTILPMDAVLMAGGRGERLRPLTLETPKPLLTVGEKAIIDYNIDELEACGISKIFITVNYLADKIIDHFDLRDNQADIVCVREPKRLGTIGALALIEDFAHDDILLMNSDLLTGIDFEAMYLHHQRASADITIAAVPYTVSVPFAIMHLRGESVTGLEEKPTYNYLANAGVYILKRSLLRHIPKGKFLDAPDFITAVIEEGGNVSCYPINGTWIDIGSPDDYRHANEMMSHPLVRNS